jgi:alanyl-tRNA synthetase
LSSFWENKVAPSNKKQGYVCRRLLRKVLQFKLEKQFIFQEWLDQEQEMRDKCLERAKKLWKRNQDKPLSWWYETVGLLPDEVKLIEWSNEH